MARTWQLRNETWQLPEQGAVMGILNITPDSFSDGGKHITLRAAMAHAKKLINEGADIIDIGGESTRPGGTPVSIEEEQARLMPVLKALRKKYPTLRISVDTRNPETALLALEAGADIINDITGLTNPAMRTICAQHPCGIVIMHMKGTPFHMPESPCYLDVIKEVRNFFKKQIAAAMAAGIDPERISLDPGIGFGKSTRHNLDLINELNALRIRNRPLLMGLSRKRFLNELPLTMPDTLGLAELGIDINPPPSPAEIKDGLIPTVGMSLLAADNGADIHRVHDVGLHRAALRVRLIDLRQKAEKAAALEAEKAAAKAARAAAKAAQEAQAALATPSAQTATPPTSPATPTRKRKTAATSKAVTSSKTTTTKRKPTTPKQRNTTQQN